MDKHNEGQKCENPYSSDFISENLINEKVENHNDIYDFNDNKKNFKILDKSVTNEFENDYEKSYKQNKYKEYSKQSTLSIDNDVEIETEYSFEYKDYTQKQNEFCYKKCKKTNNKINENFLKNGISVDEINEGEISKNHINSDGTSTNEQNINEVNKKEINMKDKNGREKIENEVNETKINENETKINENETKINENETDKNETNSLKYANDLISNEVNEKNTNILECYEENSENNLDINWNKSQIKTCIRIKPSDSVETEIENAITQKGGNKILINYGMKGENKKCEFSVDKVFNQGSTQSDVWKSICFCIDSIFYFKNATVFAHGHTGTGKTYTMIGPDIMELIKKKKKRIRFSLSKIQPNGLLINTNSLKFLYNNSNSNSNNLLYDRKRSCSQPIFNLPPRTIPLVNTNSTNYKRINDAYSTLNPRYNNKSNIECINENNCGKYENYKKFSEYRNEYKSNSKSIKDEIQLVLNSEKRGMIPRACEEIMKRLSLLKSSSNTEAYEENNITEKSKWEQNSTGEYENDKKTKDIFKNVKVYASYMQLYNDRIFDLLNPYNESQPYLSTVKSKFTNNTTFVSGLITVEVNSCEELIELLIDGTCNRVCRITKTNEMSTRSHSIFKIELRHVSNSKLESFKSGNLLLIDLAGNEKYEASNEKLYTTEVCSINRSLSALSLCINELSKGNKNISYRNSILTRLLQGSLGGSSKTVFICTISSSINNVRDSLSSLKLATKAKKIQFENKNYNSYMYEDIKKLKKELHFLKKFIFFQYITNKYESKKRLKKIKEFYFNSLPFSKGKIDSIKNSEFIEESNYNESDSVDDNGKLNENRKKVSNDNMEQKINRSQEDNNEIELNQIINTYKGIENIYNDYEFTSFNSLLLQWNLNKSSIKKLKDRLKCPNNKKYLWFNNNGNINKKSIMNFIEKHTIEYEIETDEEIHNKNIKYQKGISNEDEEDNYNYYDDEYKDVEEVDNYNYFDDEYENIDGEIDGEILENKNFQKDRKKKKKMFNEVDEYVKSELKIEKMLKKKEEFGGSDATEEQEVLECEDEYEEDEEEELKYHGEKYEHGKMVSEYDENKDSEEKNESPGNPKEIKNDSYKKEEIVKKTKNDINIIERDKQLEDNLITLRKVKNDIYIKDLIYDKKKIYYNKEKKKKKKKSSESYSINEDFVNNKNSNENIKSIDSNKFNFSLSTKLISNRDNKCNNLIKYRKKYITEKNKERKNNRDNKNEEINKFYNFNVNINKKKDFSNILKNIQEENNIKGFIEKKKEKLIRYMKMKKINKFSCNPNSNVYNSKNVDHKIKFQSSSLAKEKNFYKKKKYFGLNKIHKSEYFIEESNKNKMSPDNFTILGSIKSSKNLKNSINKINNNDKTFSVNSIKNKKENADLNKSKNSSISLKCLELKNLNRKNNFVNNIGINNLVINKIKSFQSLAGYNYKTRTYEIIDDNNIYSNDEKNENLNNSELSKNKDFSDEGINIEYSDLHCNMNDERGRSISENCCYNNLKNKTIIGKNDIGKFSYYIEFDRLNNVKKHIVDESFKKNGKNNGELLHNNKYNERKNCNNNNIENFDYKKKIGKNHLITEIEKSWLNFEKKLENKLKQKKLKKDMKIKNNNDINSNFSQISALEENKKKLAILKNRYGKIFVGSEKTNIKNFHNDYARTENNSINNNNYNNISLFNSNNISSIDKLKLNKTNIQSNSEQNKNFNSNNTIIFNKNLKNSNKNILIHEEIKNIGNKYILNNDTNKQNFNELIDTQNNEHNMQYFPFKDFNNINSSGVNYNNINSSNSYYNVKKNNYLNDDNYKTNLHKKLNKTDTIAKSYSHNNLKNDQLKNNSLIKENVNIIFPNSFSIRDANTLYRNPLDNQINTDKYLENYYGELDNKLYYIKNNNKNNDLNNEISKIPINKYCNDLNSKTHNIIKISNNCALNKDNKDGNEDNKLYSTIFYGKNNQSNINLDKKEKLDNQKNKSTKKYEGRIIIKNEESEKKEKRKIKKEDEKNNNQKLIEENKYMNTSENELEIRNYISNKHPENNYVKSYHTDDFNLKKMQLSQSDNFKSRKMHKMDFFYLNDKNNNNKLDLENIKVKKYNYINENIIPQNNKFSYINNMITYNNTNINDKVKSIQYCSNDDNHKYIFRNGIVSNNINSNIQTNPLTLNRNTEIIGVSNDNNINNQRKLKLIFENPNEYKTKNNSHVDLNDIKKRNTAPLYSYFDGNSSRSNVYNKINYVLDKTKTKNCSKILDYHNKKFYLLNYNMKN